MTFSLLRAGLMAGTMIAGLVLASPALAKTERMSVISGGEKVGFVEADIDGARVAIRYDVKNNGRGPTMAETLELGRDGLPKSWALDGTATFGSAVEERFSLDGTMASWKDSMGPGTAAVPWCSGCCVRFRRFDDTVKAALESLAGQAHSGCRERSTQSATDLHLAFAGRVGFFRGAAGNAAGGHQLPEQPGLWPDLFTWLGVRDHHSAHLPQPGRPGAACRRRWRRFRG